MSRKGESDAKTNDTQMTSEIIVNISNTGTLSNKSFIWFILPRICWDKCLNYKWHYNSEQVDLIKLLQRKKRIGHRQYLKKNNC